MAKIVGFDLENGVRKAVYVKTTDGVIKFVRERYGRWVLGEVPAGYFTPGGNRPWICSECGMVESWRLDKPEKNYCSDCGVRMFLGGTYGEE